MRKGIENSAIQQKVSCEQCTPQKRNGKADLGLGKGKALKSVGKNISCHEHHTEKAFLSSGTNAHGKRLCGKICPQLFEGGGGSITLHSKLH
jgi:hypothetical protein